MSYYLNKISLVYTDAPRPWGIYFQDSATPQMEGLIELHDNIMFYLIIILFGVGWILSSVVYNYSNSKSLISHKYLNHGKYVPIQKYSKFNIKLYISVRTYTTLSNSSSHENINYVKKYEDAFFSLIWEKIYILKTKVNQEFTC